ncbi:MAG: hypothetical protein MRJ65_00090 [Candidatus Brocadiaceae bacterium]|nr:hypothetical protein [Candidatus Brocadiaceae bacterium]
MALLKKLFCEIFIPDVIKLVFLSRTTDLGEGVEIAPDPLLGAGEPSPRFALKINVTDSAPDDSVPSLHYRGQHYSVNDTVWDRSSFLLFNLLFQTAVGEVKEVGIPVTISK